MVVLPFNSEPPEPAEAKPAPWIGFVIAALFSLAVWTLIIHFVAPSFANEWHEVRHATAAGFARLEYDLAGGSFR